MSTDSKKSKSWSTESLRDGISCALSSEIWPVRVQNCDNDTQYSSDGVSCSDNR